MTKKPDLGEVGRTLVRVANAEIDMTVQAASLGEEVGAGLSGRVTLEALLHRPLLRHSFRDELGAEIVESVDPLYPDDPSIPNMTYTFQQALAEILPFHFPEYLQRTTAARGGGEGGDNAPVAATRSDGALLFAVPNYDVTKRTDIGPNRDRFAHMKEAYEKNGPARSNLRYGYVTAPVDWSAFA